MITNPATRIETDSFGPIEVPADAYWGAQTQRSIGNFPFPAHERMPLGIIYGLAHVKRAAALVHKKSGAIASEIADAIVNAADAILAGEHDDQFPLTIWQTGSGTQSNMNVNEVIAGIANEALTGKRGGKSPVHPNDHVNMAQSSNDSFPTAMHIAASVAINTTLFPALELLRGALEAKSTAWKDIVKIGRTHLQDATPITLGQEFSGYANQIYRCRRRIEPGLTAGTYRLAQGGTAVGTGLNAPAGFAEAVCKEIALATNIPFHAAENSFEALASNDPLVHLSGTLNTLAVALTKIANDIRLLGSGPRSGFGELLLPENEPGSSIMPGKVNPTQCEMLTMVAAQVIGNHQAVTVGGMQGHLELNVFKPLIGANVLRSIELLSIGMESFATRCVAGLEPNLPRLKALLDQSLMLVTALTPEIGYDAAAKIAKHAHEMGLTLKAAALELGLVDEAAFDRVVRPEAMLGPDQT
jgi:fumarate hydratase, class II